MLKVQVLLGPGNSDVKKAVTAVGIFLKSRKGISGQTEVEEDVLGFAAFGSMDCGNFNLGFFKNVDAAFLKRGGIGSRLIFNAVENGLPIPFPGQAKMLAKDVQRKNITFVGGFELRFKPMLEIGADTYMVVEL